MDGSGCPPPKVFTLKDINKVLETSALQIIDSIAEGFVAYSKGECVVAPVIHLGLMLVFSSRTGMLECILLDEGILTELRTAACGAIAARLLGPKTVRKIGIVGTGIQARYQVDMLQHVTPCREVVLWGRNQQHIEAMKSDLEAKGKQELDPTIFSLADLVVADSKKQCTSFGEISHGIHAKTISENKVMEFGELIASPTLHRKGMDDDRITVLDSA
eukprot:gene18805-22467_t